MVLLLLETHIQSYFRQISICVFVCVHAHKPLGNDEQRRHPMIGEKDTAEISRALDPCAKLLQFSPTLYNLGTIAGQAPLSMGILQARILECVSMLFSRGSSHIPYISSVAQLCPTLCDPMDCCMQHFLVHPQRPELTQTHVHWVCNAIQPSHPLSSPSPPAFNLSQHQGLLHCVSCLHQLARVLELQHQLFQWIFGAAFL